jgi:hypothetical protein
MDREIHELVQDILINGVDRGGLINPGKLYDILIQYKDKKMLGIGLQAIERIGDNYDLTNTNIKELINDYIAVPYVLLSKSITYN